MRIYLASSWKNAEIVRLLAEDLRERGHQVYDFTDPKNFIEGIDGFAFDASKEFGKPFSEINWIEFSNCPATEKACLIDKAGMDWANTVILLLPCGRSAHMEAGIGLGQGKLLIIYGELPLGQFETVYNLTPHRYESKDWLKVVQTLDGREGDKCL